MVHTGKTAYYGKLLGWFSNTGTKPAIQNDDADAPIPISKKPKLTNLDHMPAKQDRLALQDVVHSEGDSDDGGPSSKGKITSLHDSSKKFTWCETLDFSVYNTFGSSGTIVSSKWQATCGRHRDAADAPSTRCRKTRNFDSADLASSSDACCYLRRWLLGGRTCKTRKDHKKFPPSKFSHLTGDALDAAMRSALLEPHWLIDDVDDEDGSDASSSDSSSSSSSSSSS